MPDLTPEHILSIGVASIFIGAMACAIIGMLKSNDTYIAMTRAAQACRDEMVDADDTGEESDRAYNRACMDCAVAIERLRDES